LNSEAPANMRNPHNSADNGIVVKYLDSTDDNDIVDENGDKGEVVVKGTATANKFYIAGFNQDGNVLGEQYIAQK